MNAGCTGSHGTNSKGLSGGHFRSKSSYNVGFGFSQFSSNFNFFNLFLQNCAFGKEKNVVKKS